MNAPSPNGRDGRGRFTNGNAGGPGNPYARRVGKLRSALLDAVDEDDIRDIAESLVARAKDGDTQAARELLNRLLGRPTEPDLLERMERLESPIAERSNA
jgi:hypothetical protein